MRHILTAALAGSFILLSTVASAQYGDRGPYYDRDRRGGDYGRDGSGLIRSVQEHLQRTAYEHGRRGIDFRRYDNAMKHLSEFEERLSRGRFDKGKLDRAIDDVHNVVNNNRMDERDRMRLAGDLERLREFRARYDGYRGSYGYRY